MTDTTMSNEQAPQQGEAQQTTFSAQNPPFSTENDIKSKQLDARLGGGATAGRQPTREPGFPVPPVPPMPESSQGTGGKRFGGIKGKVAAGLAVLGLMGAGGAVYGVTQSGGEDGNSDKGITLNVDSTTVRPTATPTETPTPTEIPLSERLPYKIYSENTYGNVSVGIAEKVHDSVDCQPKPGVTVTCVGIEELYLDTKIDPEGERLKNFDETVKWEAWRDRNPDSNISKEDFISMLNDPNSNLVITARGFEGASALATEIKVDLKKKFHYIQTPFSDGGLYKLDEGWKGSLRELGDELYLEMSDFGNGRITPGLQYPDINNFPGKYAISLNMARIASIFINSKSQTDSLLYGPQRDVAVAHIEEFKPIILVGEQDGVVKGSPAK